MKKGLLTGVVLLSIMGTGVSYAGTTGREVDPLSVIPYVTFEASHTWNTMQGFKVNSLSANPTKEGLGGRFGAGVSRYLNDKMGLLAEIGGGYYGSAKTVVGKVITAKVNLVGFDVLIGGIYTLDKINLFGKVGFMIEDAKFNVKISDTGAIVDGGVESGPSHAKFNNTQVLPEIKVGSTYNLNPNLGITVTYLHVWGSDVYNHFENSISIVDDQIQTHRSGSSSLENPSLDTIMLGLNYKFS